MSKPVSTTALPSSCLSPLLLLVSELLTEVWTQCSKSRREIHWEWFDPSALHMLTSPPPLYNYIYTDILILFLGENQKQDPRKPKKQHGSIYLIASQPQGQRWDLTAFVHKLSLTWENPRTKSLPPSRRWRQHSHGRFITVINKACDQKTWPRGCTALPFHLQTRVMSWERSEYLAAFLRPQSNQCLGLVCTYYNYQYSRKMNM